MWLQGKCLLASLLRSSAVLSLDWGARQEGGISKDGSFFWEDALFPSEIAGVPPCGMSAPSALSQHSVQGKDDTIL